MQLMQWSNTSDAKQIKTLIMGKDLWENLSLHLLNKYYSPIIQLGWNQGQPICSNIN